MNYYTTRHRNDFSKIAEQLNKDNNKLISAVYLLSLIHSYGAKLRLVLATIVLILPV